MPRSCSHTLGGPGHTHTLGVPDHCYTLGEISHIHTHLGALVTHRVIGHTLSGHPGHTRTCSGALVTLTLSGCPTTLTHSWGDQ